MKEYKSDKRAMEVSGSDRMQECKRFQEMDEWQRSRASVRNYIPISATKLFAEDVIPSTPISYQTTLVTTPTSSGSQHKKKIIENQFEILLEHVIGNY